MNLTIPQDWIDILHRIQKVAPDAIMAGGCLRDLDLGRPVKDIDIFVPNTHPDEFYGMMRRLRGHGFNFVVTSTTYGNNNIRGTAVDATNDPEINLIGLALPSWDVIDLLAQMDLNLCKIAYDGYLLVVSPDYVSDVENKSITASRSTDDATFQRTVKHWERLNKKYQGWPLVVEQPRLFGAEL